MIDDMSYGKAKQDVALNFTIVPNGNIPNTYIPLGCTLYYPGWGKTHRPGLRLLPQPDEFYKLVESLCPGPKLEMFSRERRDGWDAHGCEQNKFQSVA